MIKHELLKIYVWFHVTLCCAWFFLNVNHEPKYWSNNEAVWAQIDISCSGVEEVYFVPRSSKSVNRCVVADTEGGEVKPRTLREPLKRMLFTKPFFLSPCEKLTERDTTLFVASLESI